MGKAFPEFDYFRIDPPKAEEVAGMVQQLENYCQSGSKDYGEFSECAGLANFMLGFCYEFSIGTSQNPKAAFACYQKSASLGQPFG